MMSECGKTQSVVETGKPANPAGRKYRVAYLVTHPIQYQAPLLRLLSAQPDIDLTVFFQSDLSVKGYRDPGFGRTIEWDIPLLDGYRHEFLPAFGARDTLAGLRPYSYGIATRLWRTQFDVLWVHGYARWFNWIAILAARMASIPVLMRDEATSISNPRSAFKATAKRLIFFSALRAVCNGFLAIGTLNRKYYLANGIAERSIFSVPYCVDNDFFAGRARAASRRREELRTELGLSPGRPVVLYASKFQRRKRAHDLLAAFEQIAPRIPDGTRPYLLFLGDGEMRQELETRAASIRQDVQFLGFRNQSELPAFFDLCDVFVLPSEFEPWGLIINEVMSVGRPVIVSDHVGCWPDLVRNGVNGYVYPVGDVGALADALQRCIEQRETLDAMGRASRAIIEQWNYQKDLDGIRAALAAIVGSRPQAE